MPGIIQWRRQQLRPVAATARIMRLRGQPLVDLAGAGRGNGDPLVIILFGTADKQLLICEHVKCVAQIVAVAG